MWDDLIWKFFLYFMDRRESMAKRAQVELRSQYLNFLRFKVTESAAATFTQLEIDTNLSAERGVMMEIHSVEFDFDSVNLVRECAANATEQWLAQLTRETKTAAAELNDSDVIARTMLQMTRSAAIGTDAGPLWSFYDRTVRIDFPLPIPYVKPSLFAGVLGTGAIAGSVFGRIGYTLREIDREDFLELLVALQ